jgi:hypothetical protein
MKKILPLLVALLTSQFAFSQTTFERVYNIFQAKCVSCHGNNTATNNGLDLTGSTSAVYGRIVNQMPNNPYAVDKGYAYVVPGRWENSFIFRKICDPAFDDFIERHIDEGQQMPAYGATQQLLDEEKEMIRQWIQYGAPQTGNIPKENLIAGYYNGQGQPSFTTRPAAPAPGEGFQIKMGPFFIEPNGEVEWFQKYQLDLPTGTEAIRFNTFFAPYSHHFIMYDFSDPAQANNLTEGFRSNSNHNGISLVYAIQEPTDLILPEKTAFTWPNNKILDLNSHYINYGSNIYGAEVYINVYTQPQGTALEEMRTFLLPYTNLNIPNNGNQYTFQQSIVYNFLGQIHLWALMGHTHKYGTGYKVYHRNANGSRGAVMYDGACAGGIPGCVSPYFDYQHIPTRYFPSFYPLNMAQGFIHEATYENTGPNTVGWGFTSDDEMMVLVAMYVLDTTGLNLPANPTGTEFSANAALDIKSFPNPFTESTYFALPDDGTQVWQFELYDQVGQQLRKASVSNQSVYELERGNLTPGMYFYVWTNQQGQQQTGKLVLSE